MKAILTGLLLRKARWDSFVTLRPTWSQSNPLNHFTNSWQKWAWAASAQANIN